MKVNLCNKSITEAIKYMMVAVEDYFEATMLPIIAQNVLYCTHIITDKWHNQLPQSYDVVNYRLDFVDPNDLNMHTNTIKVKFHAMHGTYHVLFNSYL